MYFCSMRVRIRACVFMCTRRLHNDDGEEDASAHARHYNWAIKLVNLNEYCFPPKYPGVQ